MKNKRPFKLKIYKSKKNGEWRWNIKSGNGRIIAASSESYKKYHSLLSNLDKIREALNPMNVY